MPACAAAQAGTRARNREDHGGNTKQPDGPASGSGAETPPLQADGLVLVPLAAAAALDPSVFSKVNASEAIPASWEERARKAWEYYIEEPLVKNCVNSWRTFAVGDEIKITSDGEDMKSDAGSLAHRLNISAFVNDMILQLLVKGDAVGFKRYTKDGKNLEELVCVNPVSVKVKYAQGRLVEARRINRELMDAGYLHEDLSAAALAAQAGRNQL